MQRQHQRPNNDLLKMNDLCVGWIQTLLVFQTPKPQSVLLVKIRHKQIQIYVLLLTWHQYQPVDVLIEVVQNFAVYWSKVRWGHEVLLGPLELTVQPCHPVLQQAAGWGHKIDVNMGNTNTVSDLQLPRSHKASNDIIIIQILCVCNLVSRGIQWSAATRPSMPMLESWSENSSLSSSCSSLISSSSWDDMPFTDWGVGGWARRVNMWGGRGKRL